MTFAEKLRKAMDERGISQANLAIMTGIGKSSISQYLSGAVEPTDLRKASIAQSLGLSENYFRHYLPPEEVPKDGGINLPVALAARLMGKSVDWVAQGLRDGVFPWGYAVKMGKWSYFISAIKFAEHTGITVPKAEEGGYDYGKD